MMTPVVKSVPRQKPDELLQIEGLQQAKRVEEDRGNKPLVQHLSKQLTSMHYAYVFLKDR